MEKKLSTEDRAEILGALLNIMNNWHVPSSSQTLLLGLSGDIRPRSLQKYKMGAEMPDEKDFATRAQYLIMINNAISSLYPHNPDAASYWITTDNFYFGGQTPLDIMIKNGVEGMKSVLGHLNGEYHAWNNTNNN